MSDHVFANWDAVAFVDDSNGDKQGQPREPLLLHGRLFTRDRSKSVGKLFNMLTSERAEDWKESAALSLYRSKIYVDILDTITKASPVAIAQLVDAHMLRKIMKDYGSRDDYKGVRTLLPNKAPAVALLLML